MDGDPGESPRSQEGLREIAREARQEQAEPGSAELRDLPPTERAYTRQEMRLRDTYAGVLLVILAVQLFLADVGFFAYAWFGVHWHVVPSIMQVWLAAT